MVKKSEKKKKVKEYEKFKKRENLAKSLETKEKMQKYKEEAKEKLEQKKKQQKKEKKAEEKKTEVEVGFEYHLPGFVDRKRKRMEEADIIIAEMPEKYIEEIKGKSKKEMKEERSGLDRLVNPNIKYLYKMNGLYKELAEKGKEVKGIIKEPAEAAKELGIEKKKSKSRGYRRNIR